MKNKMLREISNRLKGYEKCTEKSLNLNEVLDLLNNKFKGIEGVIKSEMPKTFVGQEKRAAPLEKMLKYELPDVKNHRYFNWEIQYQIYENKKQGRRHYLDILINWKDNGPSWKEISIFFYEKPNKRKK